MPQDLAGRVVLITGAARGLGRAAALAFVARGARVAVNVRTRERSEELARELGEGTLPVPGDVRRSDEVLAIVERTVAEFGGLDVLVNNAAVAFSTKVEQIPEAEWRHTLDVNLTAPFLFVRAVVPTMKDRGFGRIINIASLAGRSVSILAGAHYTASKAGLLGLTRAAAKELGPYGITVNAVCPGLIDTELVHENATPERLEVLSANFPARRLGRPEEVAELICYLASDAAGYVTGASIDINGGSLML